MSLIIKVEKEIKTACRKIKFYISLINIGQLAQLVERRPYKAVAAGSSPALPTKYFKGLRFMAVTPFLLCA